MKMNCYWARIEGDKQVHSFAWFPETHFKKLQSFCGKYKNLKKETFLVGELPKPENICQECQSSELWKNIVGKTTASILF